MTEPTIIEINNRTEVEFTLPNGQVIRCSIRKGKMRIEGDNLKIEPGAANMIYVTSDLKS